MNSEVSIDVEMMEHLPAKTMLKLLERRQGAQKAAVAYAHTLKQLAPMFLELESMDLDVQFTFRDGDIDLSFTGDGERLTRVWVLLRKNGYTPSSRPEVGETSHCCFWDQKGYSRFWMSFSSSVCKRVQIGTEMKEVPVYETQCGELPVLELETAPSTAAAITDEIYF
jgi:hypothetical protein